MKGKTDRIAAHECLRPRAHPLAARGLEGVQVPLLGRDRELQQLLEAFHACREGRPQVVAVVGDAGIGKSRLVRELLNEVSTSGMLPAERCWMAVATADRPEPLGMARQLFAAAVAGKGPGSADRRLRPLLELDPGADEHDEGVRYLDPEHRKQHLYLLAREVVAAHAAEGPLLLVLEDLHWADESSLDLVRFLAARPGQLQLMFVLTHRPEFEGAAVWSTRASVRSIALPPLPEDVALQLLHMYLGGNVAGLPSAAVDLLLQRAEGNPFYLEELVHASIQSGALEREDRRQLTPSAEPGAVPASLKGLLLARMDRLEAETRRLLQEASVLGQAFSAKLLVAYSAVDGQLYRRLRELVQGEWLEMAMDPATGEPSYRFHHLLVREVAYDNLLVRARTALHRRAAQVIERLYTNHLGQHVSALAEHCYRARDQERGVSYLERAGDRARAVYANLEAATCYRRALALAPEAQTAGRTRLATRLGDALHGQGAFDEAVESWQQAIEWCECLDATDQVVALQRRIAHALWTKGRVEESQCYLAAGLSRLEGRPETAEAAALYQELASQSLHRGDNGIAVRWARWALDLSRRIDAHEQASLAANTLGVALARGGDAERGQRSMEQALRIATEHDLPLPAGRAALNLAVLYANTDPSRAAEICERGLAEARRVGDVAIQPWFYATLAGSLHACAGDYEAATRAVETAIDLDRQLGLRSHLPVPLIVLAQIDQCHGRLAEAEACYREALSLAEELADPQLLFPCLEGLGTLCLECGDKDRGRAYLERARDVCEAAGLSVQEMILLPFLF